VPHFLDRLGSWGPLGVLVFATVESAGVPNPGGTDLLLVVVTAARPSQAWLCALMAVLGSLAGSAGFFEVLHRGGEALLARRTARSPGVARFRGWFHRYGLVTVFISALVPLPGLPFKFFAACAGALGESRRAFMTVLAAARIPRYFALAYLGAALGDQSWPWVKSHTGYMAAAAAILAVGLYFLIRWSDKTRAARS
jgi:membrane protein YqaA with SNARE-associated domain